MERYFKRKPESDLSTPPKKDSKKTCAELNSEDLPAAADPVLLVPEQRKEPFNPADLPTDPALRIPISEYDPDIRDQVRRAYLKKGPCQPLGGGDVFVDEGFSNWKKKERLQKHVGGENSAHNQAWSDCEALLDEYRPILDDVSLDTLRLLLRQGLPIHGQLENEGNDGNFLELLQLLYNSHEDAKPVRLETALENSKSITADVQKDIVSVISDEIVRRITRDIGDRLFSILLDDRNIHSEDKINVVFRYVDKDYCFISQDFCG
ncbi:uncharacterized protein LOC113295972 [Papaver somniferum]|uniref:uncharacterized protein LOC113295972 n=1 Tax=Papaver somniferum TaxID=3469 RepID=UPI000E6FEE1F|nr:uncharacterized protein LOC113295972 [Papaver somniferum]